MESDPIGLGGGLNTYGYVGAGPVGFIDPFGLCRCGAGGIADEINRFHSVASNNEGKACVVTARDTYREFFGDSTIGNGLWNDPGGTRFGNLLASMQRQGYASNYGKVSMTNSKGVQLSVSQRSSFSGMGDEIIGRGPGVYSLGIGDGGHVMSVTYDGSVLRLRDQGTGWDVSFSSAGGLDSGISSVLDFFKSVPEYSEYKANSEVYTLCQCP